MLLRSQMLVYRALYWRRVERMAHRPDAVQQDVLRQLLLANRTARFGVEHGFAETTNYRQFRERVPVIGKRKIRSRMMAQQT